METWQFTPVAYLYFIAMAFSFTLFFVALKMRHVRGRKYFALMQFSIGVWVLGYSLGLFITDFGLKLIMLRVEYLGIISSTVLWLVFVASYTNQDRWLSNPVKFILLIVPILTYLQILFVEHHDFFYESYKPTVVNGLVVTAKDYGIGFYIWYGYSYFLVLSGLFLFIRELLKMPGMYIGQVISQILIVFVILLPNVFYIFGQNFMAPYDPICLSFVVMGIIYTISIYFHKFLDIAPVAYNMVFKSANSGVLVVDINQVILDVNPAAEAIFDAPAVLLVGRKINEIAHNFKKHIPEIYNRESYTTEVAFKESESIFELQTTTLTDKNGNATGRIFMFYDITARKKAIEELDAYARTVAHNLKNPMNAIRGFSELLKTENLNVEDRNNYLNYLEESAEKMHSIIDGLLLLSRIRNKGEIDIVNLDMSEIINNVFHRIEGIREKYQGDIKFPSHWPVVKGYPIWVEEIWMNYLTNALRYGGTPPQIQIGADDGHGYARFWVRDNGEGISKEDQKILFNEFTQLNRQKMSKGYGLGLSIVQRIANKLNGTIGVESEPGEGSLFYFTLPKY